MSSDYYELGPCCPPLCPAGADGQTQSQYAANNIAAQQQAIAGAILPVFQQIAELLALQDKALMSAIRAIGTVIRFQCEAQAAGLSNVANAIYSLVQNFVSEQEVQLNLLNQLLGKPELPPTVIVQPTIVVPAGAAPSAGGTPTIVAPVPEGKRPLVPPAPIATPLAVQASPVLTGPAAQEYPDGLTIVIKPRFSFGDSARRKLDLPQLPKVKPSDFHGAGISGGNGSISPPLLVPVDLDQPLAWLYSPDDAEWKQEAIGWWGEFLEVFNSSANVQDYYGAIDQVVTDMFG
jgi:hypothetical protein